MVCEVEHKVGVDEQVASSLEADHGTDPASLAPFGQAMSGVHRLLREARKQLRMSEASCSEEEDVARRCEHLSGRLLAAARGCSR